MVNRQMFPSCFTCSCRNARRRLLLSDYSDEDEDEEITHHQQVHDNKVHLQQDPAVNPHLSNPNPDDQESLPMSSNEFIDVSDTFIPTSPLQEPVLNQSSSQQEIVPPLSSCCPIGDYLLRKGLKVKREWVDSCLHGLESSILGLDVSAKAKLCFQHFLFSDMKYSGGSVLPPNVDSMHLVNLAGPFVLQVDEMVNISCPLKSRYQDARPGIMRCLKLSISDGVQRPFEMEYKPIMDFQVFAPAGLKVTDRYDSHVFKKMKPLQTSNEIVYFPPSALFLLSCTKSDGEGLPIVACGCACECVDEFY